MKFDDIVDMVGSFGPFQAYVFILVGMFAFWSYHGVAVPFVVMGMDHWCYVSQVANLTWEQQKRIAIPVDEDGQYRQCERLVSYHVDKELALMLTLPCTALQR